MTRLYAVCFTTGQVAVIDPDLAIVTDTIQVSRGSNEMAFNFGLLADGVVDGVFVEPTHRRGYVSNYIDMTISVVDLDRGSPTEGRVIGRIGLSDTVRQ